MLAPQKYVTKQGKNSISILDLNVTEYMYLKINMLHTVKCHFCWSILKVKEKNQQDKCYPYSIFRFYENKKILKINHSKNIIKQVQIICLICNLLHIQVHWVFHLLMMIWWELTYPAIMYPILPNFPWVQHTRTWERSLYNCK